VKNDHKGLQVHESGIEPCSGDTKTERGGKGIGYPKELDRDLWSSFCTSIACQTLLPGETVVGSLGTGDQSDRRRLSRWSCFRESDLDAASDARVSPLLADENTAASLPREWDEKREVVAGERRLSLLCRVARAPDFRDAVFG
jgi:hypothetical protein